MAKKLFAALMALAAIGAFAAATASANPVITHPTGTVLATGTKILGTSVGETKMTSNLGTISCSDATLTGTLTKNNTAEGVEGDIESAAFTGTGTTAAGEPSPECTTTFAGNVSVTPNPATNGLPWCVKATTATDEVQIRGGSCTAASRPIRFTMVFTSGLIGTCVYQRTAAAVGTLTTDVSGQDATAEISEQEWTKFEGGAGCPSFGKLDMKFTLETDTETASPMYFSS